MNERLQELATQAGYKDFNYAIIAHKFADLIIQECIKIVHEQDKIPEGFLYPKSAHIHELAIKQHFGIDNE
jgi:hypothetical protein